MMNTSRSNLGLWMIRRIFPALAIGAVLGLVVGLLQRDSPSGLRTLQILVSVIFGAIGLVYIYWASHRQNSGGYVWSVLERLGILSSALGAFLLSAKLGAPKLPGSILAYGTAAFGLAFVVRPILDHFGRRRKRSEALPPTALRSGR